MLVPSVNAEEEPAKPTHINLYLWLRLMLKQLQTEQIQRQAAIRLMFETSSIGALIPALPGFA